MWLVNCARKIGPTCVRQSKSHQLELKTRCSHFHLPSSFTTTINCTTNLCTTMHSTDLLACRGYPRTRGTARGRARDSFQVTGYIGHIMVRECCAEGYAVNSFARILSEVVVRRPLRTSNANSSLTCLRGTPSWEAESLRVQLISALICTLLSAALYYAMG